jgi:hypothetical protein
MIFSGPNSIVQMGDVRALEAPSKVLLAAKLCQYDSDCQLGLWERCTGGVCGVPYKKPTNDCSSFGDCLHVSVYNTSVSVPSCAILDVTCGAICVCHVGYSGAACESTQELFRSAVETRHSLVQAIRSLSLVQRPTSDALVSRITGLSSIARDSDGINDEAKRLIANMTLEIIEAAYVVRLSAEDLEGVQRLLDLVLDLPGSQSPEEDDAVIQRLVARYNEFVTSDLVFGQHAITFVSERIRSAYYAADTSRIQPLSPPQTNLETLLDTPLQSISLPGAGSYKVSVTEALLPLLTHPSHRRLLLGNRTVRSVEKLGTPQLVAFDSSHVRLSQLGNAWRTLLCKWQPRPLLPRSRSQSMCQWSACKETRVSIKSCAGVSAVELHWHVCWYANESIS